MFFCCVFFSTKSTGFGTCVQHGSTQGRFFCQSITVVNSVVLRVGRAQRTWWVHFQAVLSFFVEGKHLHSGKLTLQWEIHHLKIYLLLKMVVFHCYVSLPKGNNSSESSHWVSKEKTTHLTRHIKIFPEVPLIGWSGVQPRNREFAAYKIFSRWGF